MTISSGGGTISKSPDSSGNYEISYTNWDAGTSSTYSCTTITNYHGTTKTFYWKEGYAGEINLTYSDTIDILLSKFAIKISVRSFPTGVDSVTVKLNGYIKYTTHSSEEGSGVTPITEDTWTNESVTITTSKPGYLVGKSVAHDWYQTPTACSCSLVDNKVTINGKKYWVTLT